MGIMKGVCSSGHVIEKNMSTKSHYMYPSDTLCTRNNHN